MKIQQVLPYLDLWQFLTRREGMEQYDNKRGHPNERIDKK